ncbi:MAG: hypothetical protein FJ404_11140 [Verrucomicrobia bacterium]|nr:hypothetical protein [Verrucomicrobiota bacterium]
MSQTDRLEFPAAPREAVMQSLRELVRGLSGLFWGLPIAILLGARTTLSDWLRPLGMVPSVLAAAWLWFALIRLGKFQSQDRGWGLLLARAKVLAFVNLGLSPFLHWWSRVPQNEFFGYSVLLLLVCGLLFLVTLNHAMARLAGLLPDETLRIETQFFATLNSYLLGVLTVMMALYALLSASGSWPVLLAAIDRVREWLALFLVLLPVALTMTMVWKIKEIVLAGVFGSDR